MAAITATVQQCGEEIDWQQTYFYVTQSFIGPDDDILEMGADYKQGTKHSIHDNECVVETCRTTKIESDRTKLTFTARGTLSAAPNIISETWSVTMAQLEVPLYKYCSPAISAISGDTYGNASYLNAWENEQNGVLKSNYRFNYFDENAQSNQVIELSGKTKTLAETIAAGVDSRMCFYPQMTRVTNCYDISKLPSIADREKYLNLIDNTPQSIMSGYYSLTYSWLKSSFDIQKNADSTFTLTESWIGTPPYMGTWNEGMYSADPSKRWQMWGETRSSN